MHVGDRYQQDDRRSRTSNSEGGRAKNPLIVYLFVSTNHIKACPLAVKG